MKGTFYGIGVGPGDPDLLTMKAVKAIQKVDIIIAPKTEKKDGSVAYNIAKPYLKDTVKIVYQVFPMVKGFEKDDAAWEKNKAEILGFLNDGKNVAFLTLGDAMFYSTYIYVFRLLAKEDITVETIPGIPAFVAMGSHLGWPLVEGDDVISVIPATADKEKIEKVLSVSDNVAIMKVYKNFKDIAEMLEDKGMIENSIMVSRCGLPDEKRIDDIKAHKNNAVNYLSTILARRTPEK
ncbi:MAG: precorrin-2 C(20)-methyltransferase [Schwartzia sp.]|nr:precorrin-2 C(20)-methyltransferase [Schwartzia sp. (in: firmicutes)]